MKYTHLQFDYEKFSSYKTDSMHGYIKNKLYSNKFMYVDTDKLEAGKEKFKKELLKHYNNIVKNIEEQI
jgi:hypothetical protein